VIAPWCLPRPIPIIFMSPLSKGPRKSECALTRLTTTTPSHRSASRESQMGTPAAVSPSRSAAMLARTGAPTDLGVMPKPASSSR